MSTSPGPGKEFLLEWRQQWAVGLEPILLKVVGPTDTMVVHQQTSPTTIIKVKELQLEALNS